MAADSCAQSDIGARSFDTDQRLLCNKSQDVQPIEFPDLDAIAIYKHEAVALAIVHHQTCQHRNLLIVEGYPVDPKQGKMPDAFAWTGLASSFKAAGFVEVARRSPTRPIMRYRLDSENRRRGQTERADR